MPSFRPYLAVAAALLAAPLAQAGCSRDIQVPVSNTGASIVINGDRITGIYPELLRSLGQKEGCHFNFSPVPRARLELMFETGKADVLIPATRTAARDVNGVFVPMMRHRATLISVASNRPVITTAQELLERREVRVAVVRGFDYGEAYQALIRELNKQGRLFTEVDPTAVARLMHLGAVDMTIMGPTILAGVINREPRVNGLLDKLKLEPIPELPWQYNGVYVSRRSLSAEDQAALIELLEKAAKSGAVLEAFQRYHRADIMAESVRPR
jgi:polar amino acid transport system substrate-binding protein